MNNQNQTLEGLVADLQIQNAQRADYIVPPSRLRMTDDNQIVCEGTKGGIYSPNAVMHDQLSSKLAIPAAYYRRMQSSLPMLLADNVNGWLGHLKEDKGLMLRTFETNGGNIGRALLSDRYGLLDNYDVLVAALDAIKQSGARVEIKECSVTEKRMYINVVAPEIEIQATEALKSYLRSGDRSHVGDGVISGLVITNSEVGYGSFEVRPRAVILRCNNGLIVKDDRYRRVHLGGKLDSGEINWSQKTNQKNFELIISQVTDAVGKFLSKDYLTGVIENLEAASKVHLDHPLDTVQNVCKFVGSKISMPEDRQRSILDHFLRSGDPNGSGVVHALTMEAQNMEADDRFEVESVAFEILGNIKSFDKRVIRLN